ncbi:hypothetical protein HOLleu_44710 [Holothuria leucospilota]|uniref:Uncharacterized protein n=1 Tax=Holothuria leucospilota TaxID=206669 RepID=A0A9Q0Y8M9_HOLLE|nr:hypothetical protein HOLleu_44710 [Holothuria leucospilota]
MTDFDDAMNDLRGKLGTFCYSEVHLPGRANKLLNRSSPVKFDSVFKSPSKQKPISLSPKMTSLNLTRSASDDDGSKALSDITNNAKLRSGQVQSPSGYQDPRTIYGNIKNHPDAKKMVKYS